MFNINNVSRAKLQEVFENHGFAVYDSESTESLRKAMQIELDDGSIDESELGD
jgi:carbamoylphosphate synthase small subunit